MMATSSSASSRVVHPCVLSVAGASRGVEFSTWANLSTFDGETAAAAAAAATAAAEPWLVTAAASTIRIYQWQNGPARLRLVDSLALSGTVNFLERLVSPSPHLYPDALLIGFAGPARMSLVTYQPTLHLLQAITLIDFTPWQSPLSVQDAQYALEQQHGHGRRKVATVAAVLEGGAKVALATLQHNNQGIWQCLVTDNNKNGRRPYSLPLMQLATSLPTYNPNTGQRDAHLASTLSSSQQADGSISNAASATSGLSATLDTPNLPISTGWGDIWDVKFMPGDRIDSQLLLLHNPAGRLGAAHRLAPRSTVQAARNSTLVTCLAVHPTQGRSAWLWSTGVPTDALVLHPLPQSLPSNSSSSSSSSSSSLPWQNDNHHQNIGLVVQCVNSIIRLDAQQGRILQHVAVNGWAHTTQPGTGNATWSRPRTASTPSTSSALSVSSPLLTVNPALPLALALDGATWTWMECNHNDSSNALVALVVLRTGHIYVWQPVPASTSSTTTTIADKSGKQAPLWTLLPTGHQLDHMGQVAHASATVWNLPLSGAPTFQSAWDNKIGQGSSTHTATTWKNYPWATAGLWLVGSRLGDSHLLAVGCETVSTSTGEPGNATDPTVAVKNAVAVAWNDLVKSKSEDEEQSTQKTKMEEDTSHHVAIKEENEASGPRVVANQGDDPVEAMLRQEEEALYANIVPNDHDSTTEEDTGNQQSVAKRLKTTNDLDHPWMLIKALTILDTLVNLGPLGPSTQGPIAAVPPSLLTTDSNSIDTALNATVNTTSATAPVFPVGFGSSGGLAWLTLPGRDDRNLLAEHDLRHVQALFGLSEMGLVLLAMEPGIFTEDQEDETTTPMLPVTIRVMNVAQDGLVEIDIATKWDKACAHIAQQQLLQAHALSNDTFILLTATMDSYEYYILRQKEDNRVELLRQGFLQAQGDLFRSTAFCALENDGGVGVALSWSEGTTTFCSFRGDNEVFVTALPEGTQPMAVEETDENVKNEEDAEIREIGDFYASSKIVAADVFSAPRNIFMARLPNNVVGTSSDVGSDSASLQNDGINSDFDDDDLELYGILPPQSTSQKSNAVQAENADGSSATFVAICRQSGNLEVYMLTDKGEVSALVWACQGLAQGYQTLQNTVSSDRMARSLKVTVKEMKFFSCGPSLEGKEATSSTVLRTLCLAVETTAGDVFLYAAMDYPNGEVQFVRRHFGSVSRTSKDQGLHRIKLSRKGIIARNADSIGIFAPFTYNSLLGFRGLSGQDGLLAMVPRPFWIVAERGYPAMVFHRTRHAAPAGGKPKIMNGFCTAGLGRFLTLHERVGRVGSQRLTLSGGISHVFQTHGVLNGEGVSFERLFMGVTVRRIEFIDDPTISTGDHPLYAVLISREMEVDQSDLNDDGLSSDERVRAKREKEEAKIKKQVEADLGGFDFEHEWVEEITREDVFQVEKDLGGAPPIYKQAYSLWIVDAASKWQVVDSFDLEEHEHGMTLKVMPLSVFKEEPGRSKNEDEEEIIPEDLDETLFVMVGTGTVDHNGEDVTGKGRALLFELTRLDASGRRTGGQIASLKLIFTKEIFHGPVTTLACLSVEGKNRLILGAGADVNIEQWGNNKLTQVGFFRATMQIADIRVFKNFLLLSDAYDSLHLLIYRESDKSLTLLAKEYEPVAVYAAGLLSRGASMTFLCHDDRQNVQFLQYAPGDAAARGGNKLVCRADYHLGTQTISFSNHFCRSSLMIHSATPTSTQAALQQQGSYLTDEDQRISVHFGTTDGTLCAVVPLSETVFWRLAALQSVLANALEPDGGLSPRAWRLYRRCGRRGGCRTNERKKSVIDGDLVRRYANLSMRDQEDLASAVGSSVDVILDNLLELECGSLMV